MLPSTNPKASAPRTSTFSVLIGSPNHSAHVKQSHRVHYRWHPFHGLDVRELRRERHASGEFVRVEADPGEVALIAAWMLDPVACARLESGEPLVSLSALVELHYFLIESGFQETLPAGHEPFPGGHR